MQPFRLFTWTFVSNRDPTLPKVRVFSRSQFEYYDGLARECGCEPIEEWRKRMWAKQVMNVRKPSRLSEHRTLNDEFNDDDRELVAEAYEEFGRRGRNKYRLEDEITR